MTTTLSTPPAPTPEVEVTVLRDVRPWGGARSDLHLHDGHVTAVVPHDPTVPADPVAVAAGTEVDGRGLLALPGLVNTHAHVDKSWWGRGWVSYGGEATTQGRIAHERAHRDELGIPGTDVTLTVLRELLRHGTTAVRTHVDVDLGVGLRGIEVVREALAALGGAVHAQVVAFPQDGVLRRPGVLELLDAAAAAGADHVGGLDPASIDRDPVGQIDGLFAIAERHDVGIDVHLHDGGELGAFQIELLVDRTLRAGLQGRVNVAHGFAVGDLPATRQADLVAAMGEAGLTMTTVAPIGAAPLPLPALQQAGVAVGLGTDGIRDLWSPYGTGDLLAQTTQLARLSRFRHDADLVAAARLATSDAAAFVGRAVHDLVPGAVADVVLVDAENVQDAVVRAPRRELVVAAGRVVARGDEVLV
ncbi:cytosine/adenosine deaminase-related metal-dependent hydrolase [Isoptericola jiangsuensis]|uniref:Cytosine/adenosine deaminase-related metal-dependent hydrolase n=1 Tax=Isoptericola jiangsuensis TaxID=548579 RepID=A0A2A9EYN6_9MICO|nr:amidohydrolase family protein [Isoptericola jiangsuensis]PFG43676.1 cytosine/adenosine deaminase-related metal-dependent hydrolase [Isoptericola jiangsuensis]